MTNPDQEGVHGDGQPFVDPLHVRVRDLIAGATARLDPQDRDERMAYCREHDQHGTRMHLSPDDEVIRFDWGGKSLLMVHRDVLLSDKPIRLEFISTDIPDTLEGLTDD